MTSWWRRLRGSFAGLVSTSTIQHGSGESIALDAVSVPEKADDASNVTAAKLSRARELWSERRFEEALKEIDGALEDADRPAEIHLELARAQVDLKDLTAAIDALNLAVTLDPELGPAWALLGTVLSRLDRDVEAIEAFERAKVLVTGEALGPVLLGLASCLHACKRYSEALDAVDQSLSNDRADWRSWALKGNLHYAFEDEPHALAAYSKAEELCAQAPASLLLQLGSLKQHVGRFKEAQQLFESIIERNPQDAQARWYLAQCDLVQGQWERGWRGYAFRFAAGASPYRPLPFPVWDGRALPSGTLLILADQGLGDEIMFASCFRDAIDRVRHCIIECDPRLAPIFRRSFPDSTVVASNREPPALWLRGLPTPDWQIFGGDLPALFRRSAADFGEASPYLRPDPERVKFWRDELSRQGGTALKVGLSWRGGTALTRRRSRTVTPDNLAPILRTEGCHFVNLQYGDAAHDIVEFERRLGCRIHDYRGALEDYDETAAFASSLDVVVTVCTAIVHLAGAMGQRTWVLVPAAPGWRYTLGWDHLPWYRSVRNFRQLRPGDWESPCERLAEELSHMTHSVER